jgi:DNA-binding beta-propeller fold protein YncE
VVEGPRSIRNRRGARSNYARATLQPILKPTLRAPELDGGLAWFNTRRPLTMKELRGAVVLLDFWTYCCINCMHVLPVLRRVEEHFAGQPVVVIGVHSGKFLAEQEPERIREAIGRYEVQHPVVVDDRMAIWGRFTVRSWPTLVVVRPDGTVAAIAPGEPTAETLIAFVQRELDRARKDGTLAHTLPDVLAPEQSAREPLCYPGHVLALPDGRLVLSDSGHHRLLITSKTGEVEHAIGSGLRGLGDGPFATAAFDDPQGVALFDGALYVADARNHALRRIDLDKREVTTVAGDGSLGVTSPQGCVVASSTALRSPWGLAVVGDSIYVAMAGSHQIYRYFPRENAIEVYAGTGVEALLDGPVARSAWAQPSGMSVRGSFLYVADSETSALRKIDLDKGEVTTLIGEGLFDFGDEEGTAEQTMLQHPLDVAVLADGGLLVADTYNGKLKRVDRHGVVRTVVADLDEPGCVTVAPDGAWLVADTNGHRVLRIVDGKPAEVVVTGAPVARIGALIRERPAPPPVSVDGWFTAVLELADDAGLAPGDATIRLRLAAPQGTEIAEGSALRVAAEVSRRSDLLILPSASLVVPAEGARFDLDVPVRVSDLTDARIEAELLVAIDYLACVSGDAAACFPKSARVRVPVRLLRESGAAQLAFDVALPAVARASS